MDVSKMKVTRCVNENNVREYNVKLLRVTQRKASLTAS